LRTLTLGAAALCAAILSSAPAHAQSIDQTVATGPAPVIRIQARSADVTIRTWNRPTVEVTSTAPVRAMHFGPQAVQRAFPGGDVAVFETQVQTVDGTVRLPQEDFPVDGIAGSPHDGVAIFGGDSNAAITVTAPASSALVLAFVARGSIHVSGYHGAMVTQIHNGGIDIAGSSGQAYVEAARGSITVTNSGFDRIRARTAIGNVFFSGCTVRQIEVNAIRGHITYDNGSFSPGLARFETLQGNIALGIASGGVQIGAHSSSGRIVSEFNRTSAQQQDAQATVNGGGPVVTANAANGTVYLYSGSFRSKPANRRRLAAPRANQMLKAKICAKPRCRL
jgi:hypothetical protein